MTGHGPQMSVLCTCGPAHSLQLLPSSLQTLGSQTHGYLLRAQDFFLQRVWVRAVQGAFEGNNTLVSFYTHSLNTLCSHEIKNRKFQGGFPSSGLPGSHLLAIHPAPSPLSLLLQSHRKLGQGTRDHKGRQHFRPPVPQALRGLTGHPPTHTTDQNLCCCPQFSHAPHWVTGH